MASRRCSPKANSRVVHLAAQAGVRHSLKAPHDYIDSNIIGFLNVLEGCRHAGTGHLLYASSSSVYGANTAMPFNVSQNVDHPLSLYGASKKANELMAHAYAHLFALPTTGLRFFTVYGPWGRPDMAHGSSPSQDLLLGWVARCTIDGNEKAPREAGAVALGWNLAPWSRCRSTA
jgi:nucleoside-diphosphate-sugar epimerase